ncbi:MAG TPA: histidine phosphatase family protein [Acidimicrobiales bacterium]|nr:histidine phosphatase family protein [Acidimicrobiales bacterium]
MASEGIRQQRFSRPPGACELLLVRHGESAAAVEGQPFPLVDGQGDPPLHPEGEKQAVRVADRLEGEDIAAIYVTTLQRTAQTAAPLAERLGLTPVVEPRLREVHLGEWEGGMFRKYVADQHPLAVKMQVEGRWDVIPGSEPAEVFRGRVRDAITDIAARHVDQCVVVVSHGGTMGEIIGLATGGRPFAFNGSDNASISHLVVWGDRWILRRYNDATHLGAAFTTRPEPLT